MNQNSHSFEFHKENKLLWQQLFSRPGENCVMSMVCVCVCVCVQLYVRTHERKRVKNRKSTLATQTIAR